MKEKVRKYFPQDFKIEKWDELKKVLQEMLETEIMSTDNLIGFIDKYGELSDILEEVGAWKQIRMTQFADDPKLAKEQTDFYEFVVAPATPYFFELDKKIFENEFFRELPREKYGHLGKILHNEIEIFREENIPLLVKENELANKYGEICSQLTVEFEGKEKTLDEMSLVLKDKNREKREKAWRLVQNKMLEKKEEFEKLFDDLKALRGQIAKNAGFDNYRDFAHQSSGRFDYTPEDLYKFHNSVETVVLSVLKKINQERKEKLGVETLRPWDMSVDLEGNTLKPFKDTRELLAGSINILKKMDQDFADIIIFMSENKLLDLDNRKGKSPGGYSCSLNETGADFIFMNAIGVQNDVQTLLHESGHALHAFAMDRENISKYKNPPMEVNELASMSMELFILDYLGEFYSDKNDIKKAKKEQFEDVLFAFPAIMVGDAFQHWIYLNPEKNAEERDGEFAKLKDRFATGVDWSGLEKEREIGWLGVLHFFEVPFYYIEYAIAQLGAIALYKHFKENPERAICDYKKFMALGYSKSVPEIYAAAGIKFDFSKEYLREMIDFMVGELEKLDE
ncbi:MAG: M3 family oligoendopeptidase [Candidatus Pacebacteria bacterium]|nr:M3 family oligoendopeptidase [Candidatus Paceibacterota bacterium]